MQYTMLTRFAAWMAMASWQVQAWTMDRLGPECSTGEGETGERQEAPHPPVLLWSRGSFSSSCPKTYYFCRRLRGVTPPKTYYFCRRSRGVTPPQIYYFLRARGGP